MLSGVDIPVFRNLNENPKESFPERIGKSSSDKKSPSSRRKKISVFSNSEAKSEIGAHPEFRPQNMGTHFLLLKMGWDDRAREFFRNEWGKGPSCGGC